VINPDGAINQTEGSIVDGIGVAMYGGITFKDGVPEQNNFDSYEMIRNGNSFIPESIDVHFIKNEINPTGMGEPVFPPVMGSLANALYKATGKRLYKQPFINNI
jgi:CO/xanthine dehydrogenase Mo-binding subunit